MTELYTHALALLPTTRRGWLLLALVVLALFNLRQVLIALDQLANALIPGGWADETLSSRAHRMSVKGQPVWGWTAKAINALFFWQSNHCRGAYRDELERRQAPPETRGTPAHPQLPPGHDPDDF